MKITKYPQSCLLIEKGESRVLIDPGSLVTQEQLTKIGDIDAVCFTHRHADHFEPAHLERFFAAGARIFANGNVIEKMGELGQENNVTAVQHDDRNEVADFALRAYELPHCRAVDGSPGPPNTGFVFDEMFFHPGDGAEDPRGTLTITSLGLPIAGPSISFYTAFLFAQSLKAETIIPMHYDVFPADPQDFARRVDGFEVAPLTVGETIQL